jgi:hypothetical protein
MQEARSNVSEATVMTDLGGKNGTLVFPGPIKGYVETAVSSTTDKYYYQEPKWKSLRGYGGFSIVERYVQSFQVHV